MSSPAPLPVWRDALLAVALVSTVSLAGLGALAWDARVVRRWAPHGAAVAVGALLGAALFQLVPEARERHATAGGVVAGVLAGCAVFWALERVLHGAHDHHGAGHEGPHGRGFVRLALAGDALHNFVDGALIAATFLADARAGVLTTAAVALHEVPREFGTFGAIVHGGVPARRALAYNAATAGAATVGVVVTLAFGSGTVALAPAVLPFAAGNFVYLAGALAVSVVRGGVDAGWGWARQIALVGLGLLATGAPALV